MLLSFALHSQAQKVPDCGNEDQRLCDIGDREFWTNGSGACEVDLNEKAHSFTRWSCENDTRRRHEPTGGWLGWAMKQQRFGIGGTAPVNQIFHFGTHNSYSNYTQAFLNPLNTNQLWSITDQLQMGARYIRLDPHWFNSEMRLCHAESNRLQGTSCDAPSVSPGRLYGNGVREIANWLEANPTEVVILTMNDYSEDHAEHIEEPIEKFLGSKVFKPAHKRADRWPTLNEMLAAKRQIIIFSNDTHGDDWIFPKNTWIEAPNYPDNENFLNCFDNDGKKIHDRSHHKWAAITEGRTGSDEIDSHIFLLNEQQVRAATKCGYSMVGVDFLNALHAAWSKYSRDGEDGRREASIWSYEEADFGERGPAVVRGNSGRWYSHLETNYHQAACSLPDFSPTGKAWKVTQTVTTYYGADNQCKAEFGTTWKFDFPHNGYENERIRQLALGRDVWTKYSAIKIREVAAAPPYMLFLMDRASNVPPSRTAKVYGIRENTSYSVNISFQKFMGQDVAPWLAFATTNGGATDIIRKGGSPVALRILPAAQNLQVGGYDAIVTLTHSTGVATITVHLEIKEPVTVTLTPKVPTVNDGQPVEFTADVAGRRLPGLQDYITGTVILWKLIDDSNGNPIDSQEIARGQVNSFDGSSVQDGRATLVVPNLEGGTYKLVAEYVGDSHYGQRMSETLTYTVQRFVTALPNPLQFKVKYNGSSPNSQLLSANVPVTFSTLNGNPASFVTLTRASDRSANINVSSIGLEMGHYEQMVIVTSPVNGRHDHVRVFLDVTTSIFGDKQSIAFTPQNVSAGSTFRITAQRGAVALKFDVQTTSGGNWLQISPGALVTPSLVQVRANTNGLTAGAYTGKITVTSDLAILPWIINVSLQVYPKTTISGDKNGVVADVDGIRQTLPYTAYWTPGSTHIISVPTPQTIAQGRMTFQRWGDANTNVSRTFTASASDTTISAAFKGEYLVAGDPVPAAGGALTWAPDTPDHYYPEGSLLTITAKPKAGYEFKGFSGALSGLAEQATLTITGPAQFTAVFAAKAATGPPNLYVSTAQQRTDAGAGQRRIPVNVTNASLNTASGVSINAITDFKVVSGTGAVSVASPLPIPMGGIGPNASAYTPNIVLNWPATATRVQMTFHVSANGGSYTKTTTLTVMR